MIVNDKIGQIIYDADNICFFGVGVLLKDCFKQLCTIIGKKPDYLSDNDSSKFDKSFYGVKCISPKKISLLEGKTVVIITIRHFENIYKQLNELDIDNILFTEFDRGYNFVKRMTKVKSNMIDYSIPVERPNMKNRWALITGASRGIGFEIASNLINYGINIVIHSRNKKHNTKIIELCEKYNVKVLSVQANLENEQEIEAMLEEISSKKINIDIIYNNAGISLKQSENIWDIEYNLYLKTYQVNVLAPIKITNYFLPKMIKNGYGRVINLTSSIFHRPLEMGYACSKAALDKYIYDISTHINNTNVLISSIDPGWINTDMGGSNATSKKESIMPGAIIPLFLDKFENGQWFSVQDFAYMSLDEAINKAQFIYHQ